MGNELVAVGGALLAAGVLARAGRRLGLPTIPLFMIAGIMLGPNTPGIELVQDPHDLELLAALGLILLLFHLGLEFSLDDLAAGGRRLLGLGALYLLLNIGGGLAFGAALGWGHRETLVIAGAVGISSSAIVTKLLVELKRLANPESRLILGIIVVEDIFLALYLAILEPVLDDAQGIRDAATQIGTAFAFLLALAALARWGSRLVSRLVSTPHDELLTISFVGVAILIAGIAEELGVSDAIGAFMAGLILAESTLSDRIERLVLPLRDVFAALFFFAFGLTIDPGDAGGVALPVTVAVVLTVALNATAGLVAARLNRYSARAASAISLTILARGEFSLILAALAANAGLDNRVGPFIALYVLVLAVAAPILAARSDQLAGLIPQRLIPQRLLPGTPNPRRP